MKVNYKGFEHEKEKIIDRLLTVIMAYLRKPVNSKKIEDYELPKKKIRGEGINEIELENIDCSKGEYRPFEDLHTDYSIADSWLDVIQDSQYEACGYDDLLTKNSDLEFSDEKANENKPPIADDLIKLIERKKTTAKSLFTIHT